MLTASGRLLLCYRLLEDKQIQSISLSPALLVSHIYWLSAILQIWALEHYSGVK